MRPQRRRWLLLVPQIDQMKLIVGFAAQQQPLAAGLLHLLEAARAIAPRQEHQHAQDARRTRRDRGVVVIQAQSEVRVAQRRIERDGNLQGIVNAFAVARGREILAAVTSEQHARPIGAAEIEPCFRALRLARDPAFSRADGRVDAREQRGIATRILWVQLKPPVIVDGSDHVAGGLWRGRARRFQLPLDVFEAGLENEVVRLNERLWRGEPCRGSGSRRQSQQERGGRDSHGRLVRISCFSVWRSRASAIRRSSSSG